MNTRGAFTFDVSQPSRVRIVHGNFVKGFWVHIEDTPVELGPFWDPAVAEMVARRWDGALERANG